MINYNLKVNEKQNFLIQLRILKPDLPLRTLEVLYYVWKYPDNFAQELVKAAMYKNLPVVNTTISNLTDMELLIATKTEKGLKRELNPEIKSKIVKGSTEIRIKLTEQSSPEHA